MIRVPVGERGTGGNMTVKEWKRELECYDEDKEVVFEFTDEIEPESVTEDKYGNVSVRIDAKFKESFVGEIRDHVWIELSEVKA